MGRNWKWGNLGHKIIRIFSIKKNIKSPKYRTKYTGFNSNKI